MPEASSPPSASIEFRDWLPADIPDVARLRALEWGEASYWERRLEAYLAGRAHPQQALLPRTCLVAVRNGAVIGFVSGHLTRRYECEGEVQWINVAPEARGRGIATLLLRLMAKWFVNQGAHRICVDADPDNVAGRALYLKNGARPLNPNWLVWDDIGSLVPSAAG